MTTLKTLLAFLNWLAGRLEALEAKEKAKAQALVAKSNALLARVEGKQTTATQASTIAAKVREVTQ